MKHIKAGHIRFAGYFCCTLSSVAILVLSTYAALTTAGAADKHTFDPVVFGLLSSVAMLNVPVAVGYRDFGPIGSNGWYVQWLFAILLSINYVVYGIVDIRCGGEAVSQLVPLYCVALGGPHLLLLPLYMVVGVESRRSPGIGDKPADTVSSP